MKILKTTKRLYSLSFILVFTFALIFFINLFGWFFLDIEKYNEVLYKIFFSQFLIVLLGILEGCLTLIFDELNTFSFSLVLILAFCAIAFEGLFFIFFIAYLLVKLETIKQEKRRISIDLRIIKKSFILLYLVFFFMLCVFDILVFILSEDFLYYGYYKSLEVINIILLYILPILPTLLAKLTANKKFTKF